MIDLICNAPFPLDRIHWTSQRINGEQHRSPIEDEDKLKETFSNFLVDFLISPCDTDGRVIAEKEVYLTEDEFMSWANWYDARLSESFERKYEEAISRPRGEGERGVAGGGLQR